MPVEFSLKDYRVVNFDTPCVNTSTLRQFVEDPINNCDIVSTQLHEVYIMNNDSRSVVIKTQRQFDILSDIRIQDDNGNDIPFVMHGNFMELRPSKMSIFHGLTPFTEFTVETSSSLPRSARVIFTATAHLVRNNIIDEYKSRPFTFHGLLYANGMSGNFVLDESEPVVDVFPSKTRPVPPPSLDHKDLRTYINSFDKFIAPETFSKQDIISLAQAGNYRVCQHKQVTYTPNNFDLFHEIVVDGVRKLYVDIPIPKDCDIKDGFRIESENITVSAKLYTNTSQSYIDFQLQDHIHPSCVLFFTLTMLRVTWDASTKLESFTIHNENYFLNGNIRKFMAGTTWVDSQVRDATGNQMIILYDNGTMREESTPPRR